MMSIQKTFSAFLLCVTLAMLGTQTSAQAASPFGFVKEKLKPVKLDPETEAWFAKPGLKAIIYSASDPNKFLTIDSRGGRLYFRSCECNQPVDKCPTLLLPNVSFTASELFSHTSTWKGIRRDAVEIGAGALFLAAPAFPGVSGSLASLLGGLTFIGTAINPESKFQNVVNANDMSKKVVTVAKNSLQNQDPANSHLAIVSTGGDFDDISKQFRDYLLSVKSDEKGGGAQMEKDAQQYYEDRSNGVAEEATTCDQMILSRLDKIEERLGMDTAATHCASHLK